MNDQTIDAARELLAYYTATRRAGHTTVMLEGAMHHPCLIVSHNQEAGSYIKKTIKLSPVALSRSNEVVSLPSIARGSLRGINKPLAIDNAAMQQLLRCLLMGIDQLESSNKSLHTRNTKLSSRLRKVKELAKEMDEREF